jgi:hypothetical protein
MKKNGWFYYLSKLNYWPHSHLKFEI